MREIMLMIHFIGLAMGLGTGFTHAFLGKTIVKMNSTEAKKFRNQLLVLSQMGNVGILLLLISGIYLIIPYWPVILSFPLLIAKLVAFFILIVLIFLIGQETRTNRKKNTEGNLKRIELMGKLTLLIGIAIIILAVKVFH